MYYNIIVARPFDQIFTYESNDQSLEIGQIVIVPFRKAMEVGIQMIQPEVVLKYRYLLHF